MTERLILLGLLVVVVIPPTIGAILRSRPTGRERERRRRLKVNGAGRLIDGVVTDVEDKTLFYSYSIRGVAYRASQDVSTLDDVIDWDRSSMFGPVMLKYEPRNPANSIVACEEWSGLRSRDTLPDTEEARTG